MNHLNLMQNLASKMNRSRPGRTGSYRVCHGPLLRSLSASNDHARSLDWATCVWCVVWRVSTLTFGHLRCEAAVSARVRLGAGRAAVSGGGGGSGSALAAAASAALC